MTCASCGTENPAGTRFCLECGSRVGETCRSCGAARIGAAKFCGECGTPFADAGPAPAPRQAPHVDAEATPVAERRLVSILFADLVGFTPFAEERDAEEVRETLSRYFDLATEVIKRYGGTVEKFIGDAVMAVWGAPVAQEDDAERTVRAALELVEVVKRLGPGIQARAGVLTGEAAVTIGATNQGMVAGDLVNVAARLQSVAEPGTVLVGEATMHAASAAIAFDPIGDQDLKGKSAPVAAWQAIRVVAERGGRGRSDAIEAPFVGRTDELHMMKELLHATGREGRSRLVSIMGPAGIGKSRLAWEFLKYVDGVTEDVWWHNGRSPAYGEGIAFWALGEMIRSRAGLIADADEATTRERIAATVREHVADEGERRWIEPALLALLGIGAEAQSSEQLFAAWRTFFERMAETGTLALVFEDLHWADSGTLDFIEHVLEWSRSSPIIIVTLARPELLERRPDWGAAKRNFSSIYLEPLTESEMRELLNGLVPGLPSTAVNAIVARADGIPLYAVETVRTLIAQERIGLQDGRYVPTGDLSAISVPESLHALIAARLDALPSEERTLVGYAAVLGQSFTVGALAAVAGEDASALEPLAQELVRRELFVQNRDPRSPEKGQYAFVQALIREVAYGGIAKRDRKSRHLAAARHFESLDSQEMAGPLAVHYLSAHENAPEGPEADAIAAQARIALKAAAERATALGGHVQAVTYLMQALPLVTDPTEEAELVEAAGRSASKAGRHEDAANLLERAIELSRELSDRPRIARAIATLATALLDDRQFARTLALLTDAAHEFPDPREPNVAAMHGQLARAYMFVSDWPNAMAVAEPTLAAAEELDLPDVLADTLISKGVTLGTLGRAFEGMALQVAARDLAQRHDLHETELRAVVNIGLLVANDDPVGGFQLTRDGMALAERMGVRNYVLVANSVEFSLPAGEWDWARATVAEYLTTDADGSDLLLLTMADASLHILQGTLNPAELVRLDDLGGSADVEVYVRAVKAQHEFADGRLAEARRIAEELASRDPLNAGVMLELAAHAAVWERDPESLTRIAAAFRDLPIRGRYVDAHRRAMEAGIDGLDGRHRESLAGYLRAARDFGELGVIVDRGLVAIDMATVLGTDAPEVRAEVDQARATFEQIGARPYLAHLERAAGGADSGAPPAPEASREAAAFEVAGEPS